ncbi:hypothetical protein [Euzebya sp.]|uniref:hypothetical protein n=1 Tax=Euzebya sp. TaxID=1971409 RepID=UPI003513360B
MRRVMSQEEGSALIVVMAVTGILSLLVTVSFAVARDSLAVADEEQNVHAALAAAEAGLDDYLFRLNNRDEYWQYTSANPPAAPDENRAFTQFVTIAGGDTDTNLVEGIGMYTYDVDNDELESTGVLRVRVTGCAPGPCGDPDSGPSDAQTWRTIQAEVTQESFLDYLYFTNYETLAPLAYVSYSSNTSMREQLIQWATNNCARRRWQRERPTTGRPDDTRYGCTEIYWGGQDVVNGPFHTNDRFRLNGNATWEGTASNSDPRTPAYDTTNGARPNFNGGSLRYREPLEMPPTNTVIKVEADHLTNASAEGCLFTGPTEIRMNANGTLTVESPYTKDSGPGCGTWTNGVDPAQTIPIPDNGVIFVQEIPTSTSNPNYSATCFAGNGNGLGYPRSNDVPTLPYNCRAGDAFVEGTLDGRLTIASANNIIITWHIDYEDEADDMLGLVAQDFVQVYHPVNSSGTNLNALPNHNATFTNARIDAAILSVTNSFFVQSWGRGNALGELSVNGAIAQVYRGPVGSGSGYSVSTGYNKDYNYDNRLSFTNPPHFIDPIAASWRVSRFAEELNG